MTHINAATSIARRALDHLQAGTTDQAQQLMELPVSTYLDPEQFKRQFEAIFMQRPQALLLSVEIPKPGDYVSRTVMTKPILAVRGKDGKARVFLNVCRHRGAKVCADGSGNQSRFTCPYHSWTYDSTGKLVGRYGKSKFGESDPDVLGLTELPSSEAAGVIWASLTPGMAFNIDDWLGDMRNVLEGMDLQNWYIVDQRSLPGPGWKVTMDGYLKWSHHESVHANTLAKHTIGNLLVHDVYGHHQVLTMGRRNLGDLGKLPESEWQDVENYIRQVLCVFPNLQVSGIRGGFCLVSQILPGETPDASVTIQTILAAKKPETPEEIADSEAFSALALEAVANEDYPIGLGIQEGLRSGANDHFLIGRNEPGIQHYHRTVAELAGA